MLAEGLYYESDPEQLRKSLQRALANTSATPGHSRTVVAPYGAYSITLPYVMKALRTVLDRRPEMIILLAAPHADTRGRVLLPESTSFSTPFGELPIETETLSSLAKSSTIFQFDEVAHLQNHSLELMLPPLHYLFGPVPLLPLLVEELTPLEIRYVARTLSHLVMTREVVTLVSANLSGFTTPREADARARNMIRLIMDAPGEAILAPLETISSPPRSLSPLAVGHILAGDTTRPSLLSRGTFETDYHGETASVVFASIAYI
ncbi:AmmeMemoRadiSam system protein B [Alkalispirochaeta americana]|uniref:AmmeMemoRadiSam system protein B n=2 Tax=Alkalispirochaeta americana TaxID=159291 RepID=A0A1N6NCB0_9SPIO|nr:AmmeMemoRadiSam system protein B [Alkalispirochaeta americana]